MRDIFGISKLNMITIDILLTDFISYDKEIEERNHKYLCKYILNKT